MNTIRISVTAAYLLLGACAQTAVSDGIGIRRTDRAAEALQNYYLRPDPDRALAMVSGLIENRTWSKQPEMQRNLSVWASQILKHNPQHTAKWCDTVKKYDITTQHQAAYLFHLADTPESRRCFQELDLDDHIKQAALDRPAPDPLAAPGRSIAEINGFWAVYYATGNPLAINKMLDTLTLHLNPQTRAAVADEVFAATADALRTNMQRDPNIDKTVQSYIARLGPAEAGRMRELLPVRHASSDTLGKIRQSGRNLLKRLSFW